VKTRQFDRKPHKDDRYKTEGNVFVGIDFPITGSKGDRYFVSMHEKGFTCSCIGFTVRGKCRHIEIIVKRLTGHHEMYR
jgi:hypothetical protein